MPEEPRRDLVRRLRAARLGIRPDRRPGYEVRDVDVVPPATVRVLVGDLRSGRAARRRRSAGR